MKRIDLKNRYGFTMIELVFVIIVLGILAALALPRFQRDLRQEAADNILSAIRYTQHLALIDDKQSFNDSQWHQKLWMIRFEQYGSDWIYKVGADNDKDGNIDKKDAALDPTNGKYMYTTNATQGNDESPLIFLTQKYGINTVTFNGCQGQQATGAKHIAFDNKGRPFRGILDTTSSGGTSGADNDLRTYVSNGNCTITFNGPSIDSFTIVITQETGYAYIQGQPDS